MSGLMVTRSPARGPATMRPAASWPRIRGAGRRESRSPWWEVCFSASRSCASGRSLRNRPEFAASRLERDKFEWNRMSGAYQHAAGTMAARIEKSQLIRVTRTSKSAACGGLSSFRSYLFGVAEAYCQFGR
jgi:hypothetical protein